MRPESSVDEPGDILRDARLQAGLSVRDLARKLRLSPATVSDAERGSDVRHSTLARYLAVMPGLSPHRLLQSGFPRAPAASRAAWGHGREVMGFSVGRLRFEVTVGKDGQRTTRLEATSVKATRGVKDASGRLGVMQLLLRGSPAALSTLAATDDEPSGTACRFADGCLEHEFRFPANFPRTGPSYTRVERTDGELPEGLAPPGRPALSAPFEEGVSFAVDHPIELLELIVRFPGVPPAAPFAAAWTDLQAVPAEDTDLVRNLYADGLDVRRSTRHRTLRLVVEKPLFGLYYGIGWDAREEEDARSGDEERPRRRQKRPLATVLRRAREEAGMSQRQLASRLSLSPVTVANAEKGHDPRASTLRGYLDHLTDLAAEDVLPASRSGEFASRVEAWEYGRALIGIESDEERKTLVITPRGDAHALYESRRLRRVRPGVGDLRIRYGSAPASRRRLPTELRAVEEAFEEAVEESGLKARVVARQRGRLIHEIIVPHEVARQGASYARRMFTPGFYEAGDESESGPRYDGAAITPFHAVRRLCLTVKLPARLWPEEVWFGVHPRMMIAGPMPESDLANRLHPEGMQLTRCAETRTLALAVDYPLVGFMYDIFWRS